MIRYVSWTAAVLAALALAAIVSTPTKAHAGDSARTARYFKVELSVVTPGGTRAHELSLAEYTCSAIEERTGNYDDVVTVCVMPAAKGVGVDVNGETVTHATGSTPKSVYKARGAAVLAAGTGTVQVGRANGTRFTAKVSPM